MRPPDATETGVVMVVELRLRNHRGCGTGQSPYYEAVRVVRAVADGEVEAGCVGWSQ